jgi:hypothetical protein
MQNCELRPKGAILPFHSMLQSLAIAAIIVFAGSLRSPGQEQQLVAVRLIPPAGDVCLGSPTFNAEAVLTNLTNRALEASPDGLQSNLMFAKYKETTPVDGGGGISEITPKTWIRLLPHQSVIVPFKISVKDKQSISRLFDSPGFVGLQIGFGSFIRGSGNSVRFSGSVKSNKVYFLVANCTGKKS